LSAFLRLIRFAKKIVLLAGILTSLQIVLIIGYQAVGFLRRGAWPALPLSSVFYTQEKSREIYSTASIYEKSNDWPTNLTSELLQIPIIVPLLLAITFLAAFYFWLVNIEKRSS